MLSTKRLLQIILVIFIFTVGFLFYNVGNLSVQSEQTGKKDVSLLLEENPLPEEQNSNLYYVVGNPKEEFEELIQQNVMDGLTSMKLDFRSMETIDAKDLSSNPILILCVLYPSNSIHLTLLGEYIRGGGRVLFAAGIPEGNAESYLHPIWGIAELGNRVAANEFHILEDYIPYPEVTLDYSGYNASTNMNLKAGVTVLMEDTNQVPIVYSNEYDMGNVVVMNGTLMDNKDSIGIFASALGELQGQLLYPIIGTKTVLLDDFPPIRSLYDKNFVQLYGRSGESFLRDILWPSLLANAINYDIEYTAVRHDLQTEEQEINEGNIRLMNYLTREILKYSGEVVNQSEQKEYPVISSGFTKGNGSFYHFLSGLSLQGVVNHRIDIGALTNAETVENSWDAYKEDFHQLNQDYFGETLWLQASTVSEAYQYKEAYEQLELVIGYEEMGTKVSCNYFLEGQAFYLRSDKEVKEVQGGNFTKINERYYYIQAVEAEFVVVYQ